MFIAFLYYCSLKPFSTERQERKDGQKERAWKKQLSNVIQWEYSVPRHSFGRHCAVRENHLWTTAADEHVSNSASVFPSLSASFLFSLGESFRCLLWLAKWWWLNLHTAAMPDPLQDPVTIEKSERNCQSSRYTTAFPRDTASEEIEIQKENFEVLNSV